MALTESSVTSFGAMQRELSLRPGVSVGLVFAHPLIAAGLRATLERFPDLVTTEPTAETARFADPIDVLVTESSELERMRRLSSPSRPPKFILVGAADTATMLDAVCSGVKGLVSDDTAADDIATAVREVARGGAFMSKAFTARLLDWVVGQVPSQAGRFTQAARELSEREREVLQLLGAGASNGDIARALIISETTVRSHICHIVTKLNLPNRTQAVLFGYQYRMSSR